MAQKAKQTREHQTPTNPITGSTRYLESYVVLTRYWILWNISGSLLSFGVCCFRNVVWEVVMVTKWNDFELKLEAQHLNSTRDKITTGSNYIVEKTCKWSDEENGCSVVSFQVLLFKTCKLLITAGYQTFLVSADGTCLLKSGVVHMTCTGFQKEVIFSYIFIEMYLS